VSLDKVLSDVAAVFLFEWTSKYWSKISVGYNKKCIIL